MRLQDIVDFCHLLGFHNVVPQEDRVYASCPYATWTHKNGTDNRPSFFINDKGRYYCYTCDRRGDMQDFLLDMKDEFHVPPADMSFAEAWALTLGMEVKEKVVSYEDSLAKQKNKKDQDRIYPESWLSQFPKAIDDPDAMDYLTGRDIREVVIECLDIRWDSQRHRVCFPVRNSRGLLTGLRGRYVYDKPGVLKWYTYPFGDIMPNSVQWLNIDRLDWNEPVIIAEAAMDLAKIHLVYQNVVSPLTASITFNMLKRVSSAVGVMTFFDNDEAGDRARKKVHKFFNGSVTHLTAGDSGDAGNMSYDALEAEIFG